MRRLLLVSLLLMMGCAGTTGPRMRDAQPQKIDPRYLPIPEQEERAKALTAYPDPEIPYVGPRTYTEIPAQQYGKRSH